ncbi:hypothetical protein AGOR_G00232480 [Albula goreensis]|uniref:Uncharacterized protein n=1 Tax=Albula goreensis TaxID=1534307 RepID=A0A8T3CLS5_9TELE|nr:hypothetical protein AGOR_G00232480 [Albula goreensis]
MLWSPKFSLSNIHVKLTAKGLLRNLQLLSGCKKSTVVFHTVDKNKQKPSPRTQPQPQPNGQPDLLPPTEGKPLLGAEHYRAQCDKNNQCIQQLKKLLASGNRRFEAVTVVIQHILTEREEALKQRQELSQELVTLRGAR